MRFRSWSTFSSLLRGVVQDGGTATSDAGVFGEVLSAAGSGSATSELIAMARQRVETTSPNALPIRLIRLTSSTDILSNSHRESVTKNWRLRRSAVREGYAFPCHEKATRQSGLWRPAEKAEPFRTVGRQSRLRRDNTFRTTPTPHILR